MPAYRWTRRSPAWREFAFAALVLAVAAGAAFVTAGVRMRVARAAQDAGPALGTSLAGHMLVASPHMRDPRFTQTVIFMVRHDETGAMGLVVNRPVGRAAIGALAQDFGLTIQPGIVAPSTGSLIVHTGGPVEPFLGFVLHSSEYGRSSEYGQSSEYGRSPEYRWPATFKVIEGFSFTADPAILAAIADGTGPKRALFAFGYAGWGPGQLEGEIARADWLIAPADAEIVFDAAYDNKWRRATERRAIAL